MWEHSLLFLLLANVPTWLLAVFPHFRNSNNHPLVKMTITVIYNMYLSIVTHTNMRSTHTHTHAIKALGPYSISKTALLGLTKVLASELGPDQIRVNCIAPGVIKTKFSSAVSQCHVCSAHKLLYVLMSLI